MFLTRTIPNVYSTLYNVHGYWHHLLSITRVLYCTCTLHTGFDSKWCQMKTHIFLNVNCKIQLQIHVDLDFTVHIEHKLSSNISDLFVVVVLFCFVLFFFVLFLSWSTQSILVLWAPARKSYFWMLRIILVLWAPARKSYFLLPLLFFLFFFLFCNCLQT